MSAELILGVPPVVRPCGVLLLFGWAQRDQDEGTDGDHAQNADDGVSFVKEQEPL
jgi:hypothetical protein